MQTFIPMDSGKKNKKLSITLSLTATATAGAGGAADQTGVEIVN